MPKKLKNRFIEVFVDDGEGNEVLGHLYYNYYSGFAGTLFDPPEPPEIEFSFVVLNNDPLGQHINFDSFCEKYKVKESKIDDWYDEVSESIENYYMFED